MSLHFDEAKGVFRIRLRKGGHRIAKTLPKGTSDATAKEVHAKLINDLQRTHHSTHQIEGWDEQINLASADTKSWMAQAMIRARRRAKAKGVQFKLLPEHFEFICRRSGGRCEVTGIPFSDKVVGPKNSRPYRQSLDRIDSSGIYTLENCRLVLTAVNLAMGAWGEEVIQNIACGLVLNRFYPPWMDNHTLDFRTPKNRKAPG